MPTSRRARSLPFAVKHHDPPRFFAHQEARAHLFPSTSSKIRHDDAPRLLISRNHAAGVPRPLQLAVTAVERVDRQITISARIDIASPSDRLEEHHFLPFVSIKITRARNKSMALFQAESTRPEPPAVAQRNGNQTVSEQAVRQRNGSDEQDIKPAITVEIVESKRCVQRRDAGAHLFFEDHIP